MFDFTGDKSSRWREIANQNATSDVAFLKLNNPRMSPEEEADIWRGLFTFHLKKLKGEYPFDDGRRDSEGLGRFYPE